MSPVWSALAANSFLRQHTRTDPHSPSNVLPGCQQRRKTGHSRAGSSNRCALVKFADLIISWWHDEVTVTICVSKTFRVSVKMNLLSAVEYWCEEQWMSTKWNAVNNTVMKSIITLNYYYLKSTLPKQVPTWILTVSYNKPLSRLGPVWLNLCQTSKQKKRYKRSQFTTP